LKTAYDLYLSRELQHARIVRAESSPAAIDLFLEDRLDAVAGVRQPSPLLPQPAAGSARDRCELHGHPPGGGAPKGRFVAARLLSEFIEESKASGFVARALRESGVPDVTVARPRSS
jgi:polar amino acid transport system substrate-binding protein